MKTAVLVTVPIVILVVCGAGGYFIYKNNNKASTTPAVKLASAAVPTPTAVQSPSTVPEVASEAMPDPSTPRSPTAMTARAPSVQENSPVVVPNGATDSAKQNEELQENQETEKKPEPKEVVEPPQRYLVGLQDHEALSGAIKAFKDLDFDYTENLPTELKFGGEDGIAREYRPLSIKTVVQTTWEPKTMYIKDRGISDWADLWVYDDNGLVQCGGDDLKTSPKAKLIPEYLSNSSEFFLCQQEPNEPKLYFEVNKNGAQLDSVKRPYLKFELQLASPEQIWGYFQKAPFSFKLKKDGKLISSIQEQDSVKEGEVWVYYKNTIRPALDLTKAITFQKIDDKVLVGLGPVGKGLQEMITYSREGSVGFRASDRDIGTAYLDYSDSSFSATIEDSKGFAGVDKIPLNFTSEDFKILSPQALEKLKDLS